VRDYEEHLARIAEFSRRALSIATEGEEDPQLFYPFITLMIPVVMMADWIGNRDDMIHRYLQLIAPEVRRVTAANLPASLEAIRVTDEAR